MARGYRRLSAADEDEIWARLRAGHAAKPTARALGLSTGGVRAYLVRCGGIRPVPRRRSPGRLSFGEREEISRGLAAVGRCARSRPGWVARRRRSVVRSQRMAAGSVPCRPGRPAAWARARRPQACKLAPIRLRAIVGGKLKHVVTAADRRLAEATYPDDPEMQVSHETIYRTLFIQSRGALRKELTAHLRTGRVIRRPQGTRLPDGRGGRPGILQHLRTARRGRRSGGAWPLGGRPGLRQTDEPGRDPGGAVDPVRDAGGAARRDHKADLVADALAAKIHPAAAADRR